MTTRDQTPPDETSPRWMVPVRAGLICGGVVLGAVGIKQLSGMVADQIRNLVEWLVVGLVVHDGLLVPAVTVATLVTGFVLRRLATRGIAGRRLRMPPGGLAWVVGGLMTGGVLTLVALAEVHARSRGVAPTVLPGDYGVHLAWAWAVIIVIVVVALTVQAARAKARR
jgi:hypothetical protein